MVTQALIVQLACLRLAAHPGWASVAAAKVAPAQRAAAAADIAATTDLVAPAKILYAFQRANKELQVKAGILTGAVINGTQVKDLAELPPREVLLAKVAGGMKTPLYGLASVISAPEFA